MVLARLQMAKIALCLLIGASTLFGFSLADPHLTIRMLTTGFGVFILATGAATLNSVQEYRLDAQMERTKRRPLPRGAVTLSQAVSQSAILLVFGVIIICLSSSAASVCFVAMVAVILYNGIYTPLKQRTVLALVPGIISGALPPYIGWLAGGGEVVGYVPALIVTLLILWQVPHFLLILLNHKEDYLQSSLPHLLKIFKENKLKKFFVTWIGALAFTMVLFLTLPIPFTVFVKGAVVSNAVLLLVLFFTELILKQQSNYFFLFITLNSVLFFHMTLLAAGRMYT
jgi:protoheme IX farnesyltransferase